MCVHNYTKLRTVNNKAQFFKVTRILCTNAAYERLMQRAINRLTGGVGAGAGPGGVGAGVGGAGVGVGLGVGVGGVGGGVEQLQVGCPHLGHGFPPGQISGGLAVGL